MNPGLFAIKKRANVISGYIGVVLADGPYGFWPLVADTNDVSGNGFNGTTQGGAAVFGTPLACPQLSAAFQNNKTKYISLGNMPLSSSPYPHTVECWFNVGNLNGNSCGLMGLQVTSTGYGGNHNPSFYIDTSGYLRSGYYDGSNTCIVISSSPVTDNKPHHAVVTHSGSSFSLYLDSVLQGTYAMTPQVFTGDSYLTVSASQTVYWPGSNNSTLDYENGAIAGAAYYSKVLTATQILNHYNAGK